MPAEVLAMNARPDEPAIGVHIHFGDAELGGRHMFFFIYAARRWIKFAPAALMRSTFDFGTLHEACITTL